MKRIFTLLTMISCSITTFCQSLTQADFTSVTTPQYVGSVTGTRLPYVYRATVSNLTPNATYRYFNQAATSADLGTTSAGAGNPMYIDAATSTYTYTTTSDLVVAGRYGQFTTNSSGSYTGWFAFVNTGNARFTAGNTVFPSISLNDGASGTAVAKRLALNESMTVLTFATTSGANDGTGIRGTSTGFDKDIVALYDNSSATGRPISMTYIESEGIPVASIVPFYAANVDGVSGSWGTIIPNSNANGIKAIRRFALSNAAVAATNTDVDGVWPSGANTISPTGGSATPIVITSTDASLPIEALSLRVTNKNSKNQLTWQTASEKNNSHFAIERSNDGDVFSKMGEVKGNGNSTITQNYQFTDATPAKGINYYRLRQVDFDGTESVSKTVSVNFDGKGQNKFKVYPTLVQNVVNVELTDDSKAEIAVRDLTGRVILTQNTEGVSNTTLNLGALSSGLYILSVRSNEALETVKIYKQ